MCFVDLFPYPGGSSAGSPVRAGGAGAIASVPTQQEALLSTTSVAAFDPTLFQPTMGQIYEPFSTDFTYHPYPCAPTDVFPAHTPTTATLTYDSVQANDTPEPDPNQVLAYVNNTPIVQGTCCTGLFVGTLQAHVSCYCLDKRPILLAIFTVSIIPVVQMSLGANNSIT